MLFAWCICKPACISVLALKRQQLHILCEDKQRLEIRGACSSKRIGDQMSGPGVWKYMYERSNAHLDSQKRGALCPDGCAANER